MLMTTFAPYFQSTKNSHLKNFYLLVPALTINYIKYILKSKDRLKKNQDELVFTDDGFSMGLIYILRLLDQLPDYIALNWAKTIRSKISADKDKILKQRAELAKTNKNNDEKLLQTLLLSEMRINAFQTEFELLFYNINSVKIFFQS
jgi:WASH complex subunit 7